MWAAATPHVLQSNGLFQWRGLLLQYSGVLAQPVSAWRCSLPPGQKWPERWLSGLDKMYRLHKWLGISELIISVSHWG